MTAPLFYLSGEDIGSGDGGVVVRGAEGRHLARSLRAKPGERIKVSDGLGLVYEVTITEIGKTEVLGTVTASRRYEPEAPLITIFQSVARPRHMDEAVALAAESGAWSLIPVTSERALDPEHGRGADRLMRWRRIAVEASKVARRPLPLLVGDPVACPPEQGVPDSGLNLVLWEDERTRSIGEALPDATPAQVGLFVGPEGGYGQEEVEALEALGCVPVSLGDLILRTQSAGAYCAMLLRYRYGCLEPAGGA